MNKNQIFDDIRRDFEDLLSEKLRFECGEGWVRLIEQHLRDVRSFLPSSHDVRLETARQKYGTLVLEYANDDSVSQATRDELEKAVLLADARSAITCETCGAPGGLRDLGGWVRASCVLHGNGAEVEDENAVYTVSGVGYRYVAGEDALVRIE